MTAAMPGPVCDPMIGESVHRRIVSSGCSAQFFLQGIPGIRRIRVDNIHRVLRILRPVLLITLEQLTDRFLRATRFPDRPVVL